MNREKKKNIIAFHVNCPFKRRLLRLLRADKQKEESGRFVYFYMTYNKENGFKMVTSYPLPEGFTDMDVFGLGTALLVEGKF